VLKKFIVARCVSDKKFCGSAQASFCTFLFGGEYPPSLKRLGRLDLRPERVGAASAAVVVPGICVTCATCVLSALTSTELSCVILERFPFGFMELMSAFLFLALRRPDPAGAVTSLAVVFSLPGKGVELVRDPFTGFAGTSVKTVEVAVAPFEDGTSKDGITKDGVSEDGVSEGEISEDGVFKGGIRITKDGVTDNGIAEGRTTGEGIAGDGATKGTEHGVAEDSDTDDRVEVGSATDGDGSTRDGVTEDEIANDGATEDKLSDDGVWMSKGGF
jgi:hypothetical protein